jgi:hypothetical protein
MQVSAVIKHDCRVTRLPLAFVGGRMPPNLGQH